VFSGSGESGQRGVYAAQLGGPTIGISTIADVNTPIPNGTGNFRLFGTPSISEGDVAFPGGPLAQPAQGIYFVPHGGSIKTIVDSNTAVPGGIGIYRGVGGLCLDHGSVAFVHSSMGLKDRILVADNQGQITFVAESTQFNGLSLNQGTVAFISSQNRVFAAPIGSPATLLIPRAQGSSPWLS
jgi:hypothetical protein